MLSRIARLFCTNRRLLHEILERQVETMAKIDELLQATVDLNASVDLAIAKIDALKNSGASEAQLQAALDAVNAAKAKLDAAVA